MVYRTGDNNYATAKWIVDPVAGQGTHTTISGALTSASSGDDIFIRPGSYTENLTLKAGVNLIANTTDADTPTVTIIGKCTMTVAGIVGISGIRLQTNSDFALAVTGSAASVIFLRGCYLNCTNNTGISSTTSSSSSAIFFRNCWGNIGTTGIACFAISGAGIVSFDDTIITNSGGTSTASTSSSGGVGFNNSSFAAPITTSGTGSWTSAFSGYSTSNQNVTAITIGEASGSSSREDTIASGTAAGISVSAASTCEVSGTLFNSTNTNPITGAGTVKLSTAVFNGTGVGVNPTTLTATTFRYGFARSSTQPSFLYYLAATVTNKTGNAAVYTLGTDALTKVFDQGNNCTTGGVFTAPVTGKYHLGVQCLISSCTIATIMDLRIVATSRTYDNQIQRAASANNLCNQNNVICDMNAGDTATFTVSVGGEAGNTNSVFGSATMFTFIQGYLVC